MKLYSRQNPLLLQIGLILLCSASGTAAKAADVTVQKAEASAVITTFAMDALRGELPAAEFAAWPALLRDSAVYRLDGRPSTEWSPELRLFVLSQFRRHLTDLEDRSQPFGQVKTWLQRPDPWKDTTLVFYLQPALGVQTLSQNFSAGSNVSRIDSEDGQLLSRFLSSLSAGQKAKLLASRGRIPQSELTEQQRVIVKQVMHGDRDYGSSNGIPFRPFDQKDSVIKVSVVIQALVTDTQPGASPGNYVETILSRPLNPKEALPL